MVVSDRDVRVFPHDCVLDSCKYSCQGNCQLCTRCLNDEEKYILKEAYREHLRRGNCRRVIPSSTYEKEANQTKLIDLSHLSSRNALLKRWFQESACKILLGVSKAKRRKFRNPMSLHERCL
ncbi:uncharacterized protein LOC106476937 [Limulus polyphemus]|uniref:Uncharacterized protein LOC106476937 n=1 Tax=Limulus polyphemus TaxID=6850 RepID=A0ABM1C2D7_LIMPO|nr:uncharacterized protein LOC106476937 [Limulus polyphemus]